MVRGKDAAVHRDQAGIADFNTSLTVNDCIWTEENVTSDADGATKSMKYHARFDPHILSDLNISATASADTAPAFDSTAE